MICRYLTITVLAIGATLSQAQPSLPSSFQAKTIHSPEGADIFVRWGGKGPVVMLLHGYAENAYTAMYADKVERLVVMDAPIPGIGPWAEILQTPGVWHFNFHGPDAERLVAGRERIYLDRIWNDFTGNPSQPDDATRNFFAATYAQPGGMRAGFAQFAAFSQDAADNKIFAQVKLTMPVLAVGGEKSFGPLQAVIMRNLATNVQEAVVPGSGHWLMEESPVYTVALIRKFIDSPPAAGTSSTPAE